jgi:hypothetical protein
MRSVRSYGDFRAKHVTQQCHCTEFNTRDRGPARRAGEAWPHGFFGMSGCGTDSGDAGRRRWGFLRSPPLGVPSLAPAGDSLAHRSVAARSSPLGIPSLTARSRAAHAAAVIRDAAASAAAVCSELDARMRQRRPPKCPTWRETSELSVRNATRGARSARPRAAGLLFAEVGRCAR